MPKTKYINDPIYGFIKIKSSFVLSVLDHPFTQRLRRISQMGLSQYVYPSATHSRFQHSLGAMHLMSTTIDHLEEQGVPFTSVEREALLAAILLHDIGHGPFSHALENRIIPWDHEKIGRKLIGRMKADFDDRLDLALQILEGHYHRPFFTTLVSSQLDMDRIDYINRDSYYTGVIDGRINYMRLIQLMNVSDEQMVFDEKGLDSLERYLLSRKHMYLEVYLHKAAMTAERMLMRFFDLLPYHAPIKPLGFVEKLVFNRDKKRLPDENDLNAFSLLDDSDIIYVLKKYSGQKSHPLSLSARRLLHRELHKTFVFRSEDDRNSFFSSFPEAELDGQPDFWEFDWKIYREDQEVMIRTRTGEVIPYTQLLGKLPIRLDPIPFYVATLYSQNAEKDVR